MTASEVIVDVGYKSEGIIPVDEFIDETGQITVQPGDSVDVLLERTEDREGYVVLSREKAEKMKIWDEVEKAYAERKVVIGRVIERIKGGLAVDIGVRAFLPGSQIDVRPVRNLDALRGQELRMRVIKVNKKRGNIVLSRKVLLEEENAEKKKHTLDTLAEGKVLNGVDQEHHRLRRVRRSRRHRRPAAHHRHVMGARDAPVGAVQGQRSTIDVIVLKYDAATERVSLGHKQLMNDPWSNVIERYPVGARMSGKVVSLTDYGAFVELEPGVEGLIHVSEMSWSKRVKHPSKVLNVGDTVEAMVLGVDPGARRISLGLKQVESNPWHELSEKYPIGTTITGKVRNLTEFGAFVEVEEGIDGLIHISDMSWSKRLKHPSEALKKGDTVEAMVLNIDAENQRLSLGLKQLQTDVWDEFFSQHNVGDSRRGQGRPLDQLRRVRRAGRRHRRIDPRLGVRRLAAGGQGRQAGTQRRRELPDEDHQAHSDGTEDRPQHPRAEERRIPGRLGSLHRDDRPAGSDAGRSLQAPAVKRAQRASVCTACQRVHGCTCGRAHVSTLARGTWHERT